VWNTDLQDVIACLSHRFGLSDKIDHSLSELLYIGDEYFKKVPSIAFCVARILTLTSPAQQPCCLQMFIHKNIFVFQTLIYIACGRILMTICCINWHFYVILHLFLAVV